MTNAAHQVLLGQSPQAMETLGRAFNLSARRAELLLTCDRGQGILAVGTERRQVVVPPRRSTGSPPPIRELAALGEDER